MAVTTGNQGTVVLGTGDTEIVADVSGKQKAFFIISNVATAARTFRFAVYDGAGSASQANAIFYDKSLAAGEVISLEFYMANNETVTGLASAANSINVRFGLLGSSR